MALHPGTRPHHRPVGPAVRVVADIGGTNARFATVGPAPHELQGVECLRCADYDGVQDAVNAYTASRGIGRLDEVCLAVAGPVDQDFVDLANNPWTFSRSALQRELGARLTVINDFTAQAACVDALQQGDVTWIGRPRPRERGIRAILGPGTGLGVAVLMPDGTILPSEGGHVAFAPTTSHEIDLLQCLLPRYPRVSAERLISGPGLENLYWANRQLRNPGAPDETVEAPEIARRAAAGERLALDAVGDFFDILASYAGDVALFTWSTGGVFLSGGVLRKLSGFLDAGRFRARFEDKGRFNRFFERMPVAWINHPYPGLLGCAAVLYRTWSGPQESPPVTATDVPLTAARQPRSS